MRIAAFGFRTLPPSAGAAGADKFALELLPRLAAKGHQVIAYNRRYRDVHVNITEYKGVKVKTFKTVRKKGFDTLLHSMKCTFHIIFRNSADVVHIQNGGNSIWALPLRLFGKKFSLARMVLTGKGTNGPGTVKCICVFSANITARFPNEVIFDNIIARRLFEEKFKKKFEFIPFGSESEPVTDDDAILKKLNLEKGEYMLFVGRFIPDKGLHYLIPGFIKSGSRKKLVLVGGSPNPSPYEQEIMQMANDQVVFAGYVYGADVTRLMKYSFCYIQPSDVEGLSPVVLSVMGLNVPLIVSDIEENQYAVRDTARTFAQGNSDSLAEEIRFAERNPDKMKELAAAAQQRALTEFNWDKVTDDHLELFRKSLKPSKH
ncbi:MAG: glycosyltransferase family 4 protein [Chitinophagaceae bacterium]|nr:glycosyltransferase family 4 protein [Chitinophagaceae bacterium]